MLSQLSLVNATGELTTAQLTELMTTKSRSKADAEALLLNTGLITSETAEAKATNVVTAAKLQELVQTKALTQAEADLIAVKAGVVSANQKESISFLSGIGAKIKGFGAGVKNVGNGVLALAKAHPAIAAITTALTIGTIAVGIYKKKQEETAKAIKEAYEEAKVVIDEINTSFKNTKSSTKEISKEYAELAQGVNLLTNENKKLSTEKYERFLELSNQLSTLYPSLTKRYDENGNAILDLSGDVDTIVGSLDDLIERQRALANQEIVDRMPELFKGYSNNVSDYKKDLTYAESVKDEIQKAYETINNWDGSTVWWANGSQVVAGADKAVRSLSNYTNALDKLGIKYKKVAVDLDNDPYRNTDGFYIDADYNEYNNELHDIFVNKFNKAQEDVKYAKMQLESETSSINQYLNTWLQTEFSYNRLEDDGLKQAVQEALFNFDWSTLPDDVDQNDWEEVSEYLRRNILFSINNINDAEVSQALADIYTKSLSSGELLNAIEKVQEYFGKEHPVSISLGAQVEDITPLITNVKDKLQGTEFDDKVKELSLGDLEIAADKLDVPPNSIKSWDELIAKIEEYKKALPEDDSFSLDENDAKALSDYQSKIDSISKSLGNLYNLEAGDITALMGDFYQYSDIFEKWGVTGEKGVGNLKAALEEIATSLKDTATTAVPQMTEAIEEMFQIIMNPKGSVDKFSSEIEELEMVLEKVRNGENIDNIEELINKYGDLEGSIIKTTDGYSLEEDAIVSLLNTRIESYNSALAYDAEYTKQYIENVEKRVKAMFGVEAESLRDIANYRENNSESKTKFYANREYGIDPTRFNLALQQGFLLNEWYKQYEELLASIKDPYEKGNEKDSAIDWMTTSLANLQEKVDDANRKLENTNGLEAQMEAIKALNAELGNLRTGYELASKEYGNRYSMALADLSKLDLSKYGETTDTIKAKIEAGDVFNLKSFPSDVAELINDAIDAWNGKRDSDNKVIELGYEIEDNTEQVPDFIMEEFEYQLALFENKANMIEAQLANAESRGQIATQEYYKSLKTIAENEKLTRHGELDALRAVLNSGVYEENSKPWRELQQDIAAVELEIKNAENEILEFDNKISQVDWDVFNFERKAEQKLIDEADFMIDLLDSAKLFSDAGEITAEGLATMGLHAQNYNAYLEQSIAYAEELADIQKKISDGTYSDTDKAVIDRRNELLELQQESILASENERDAMISLVEEGIEKQKESFSELISQYNDALDIQKD